MRFEPDAWRKSSFSHGGGGECVEVAFGAEAVGVRDSKNTGPVLVVDQTGWAELRRSLADR